MARPFRISAILPCFEEAVVLPSIVTRLGVTLAEVAPGGSEIVLVVSEASGDGTPDVAATLSRRHGGVRTVVQPADDPGYGRAIALGVGAARHPWLLLMDADGQMEPRDLPRFAAAAMTPGTDAVIGYRAVRADRVARRLAGHVYRAIVPRLFGLGVRDLDCGFKLVRRRALGPAPLGSRTGVVNAELLARVARGGGRILELPVKHRRRPAGRSRFELSAGLPAPAEIAAIVSDLLALRVRT